jgi:nucleoid-associated protein YgaU/gas vesicle protein
MKNVSKNLKRILSLMLLVTLISSQTLTAHAWGLPKIKVPKVIKDAADKVTDTAKDVADEVTDVAKDVADEVTDVAKDVADEVTDVAKDAVDIAKDAVEEGVNLVNKVLKDNPELREIDLLPVLNLDVTNLQNVLTAEKGSFTYGDNVKEKKLPIEAEKKLIETLKDIGLTNYWANFVIDEVSSTSGDINVGEYVTSLLPYSSLYGDKIEDAINSQLQDNALVDINPFIDGVVPSDDVEGMNFTYTIDGTKTSLTGSHLIVITGLKYGKRDKVTVKVKVGNQEIVAKKRALNKKEIAFVAKVDNAVGADKLDIIVNNEFDKPADIAFEIADGIQDGLNDLVPFGNPISNGARDDIKDAINGLAFYMEKTEKDKHGNAKTNKDGSEKKKVEEVSLNDVLGDGDAGKAVTELVYKIPGIGSILKPVLKITGGDDEVEKIIRKVVGQTEVKSYLALREGKIYIKSFDNSDSMNQEVTNSTAKTQVNINDYSKKEKKQQAKADSIGGMGTVDLVVPDAIPDEMPTEVIIKLYDTVGNISLRYYGDYSMKDAIYKANKAYFAKTKDKLNVGDTLVLPEPAKYIPPVENENTKVYVVKANDTLAKIAKKFYNDAKAFDKIVEANQGIIKHVNKIYEGQILAIPVE